MNKAILLDFDGVIVRNRRIDRAVANACVRSVARVAGVSFQEARRANRQLYPSVCGHSSEVLRRAYGVACDVEAFNRLVYEEFMDYRSVERMLTSKDRRHADRVASAIQAWGPERTFVFSNAPVVWCERLADMFGVGGVLSAERMACSDATGALKPRAEAYEEAERIVREVDESLERFVLVDDAWQNVRALEGLDAWTGIHFPSGAPVERMIRAVDRCCACFNF